MNKLGKKEIVELMVEKLGGTKKAAEEALQAYIDVTTEAMERGDKISLVGYMTYEVSETKERNGRNPKTGEEMVIPAGKKVKIKVGSKLKEAVK